MRTPKKGDQIRIHFKDHIKNAEESPKNIVWGRVHKITEEAIILDWWAHPDPEMNRNLGDEVECVTIMRRVIDQIFVSTGWREL